MKPVDDTSSRARPARRGARTGRGPWLMLAVWIGAVAVLFIVGLLIRGIELRCLIRSERTRSTVAMPPS